MSGSRTIVSTARFGLIAAAVATGCDAESQIERTALWLCRYGQLTGPNLATIPSSEDPWDHLHPDDLAYLESDMTEVGNAEMVALAKLSVAIQKPATQAFGTIRALHTTCHVDSIVVTGETAEVEVRRSVPDLESPLALQAMVNELTGIPFKQLRMAYVQEQYARQSVTVDSKHEITFRLTDSGWRAAFDVRNMTREAIEAVRRPPGGVGSSGNAAFRRASPDPADHGAGLATQSADEAAPLQQPALQPSQDTATTAPEAATEPPVASEALEFVEGGWFRRPEDEHTTVALAATTPLDDSRAGEPPELRVRCSAGELEVFLAAGVSGAATDTGQAELAVSWNGRKAKTVRVSVSAAEPGFVFLNARTWVKRLSRRNSRTLTIEIPLSGSTDKVGFTLDGSTKAVRPILKACKKKRGKRRKG